MYYIQYKYNGNLETIDEFASAREARKMLAEYRLAFAEGYLYLSTRACKDWRDKGNPDPIKVILRVDKEGQVFALMPELPSDYRGLYCSCYTPYGHTSADLAANIQTSKPVSLRDERVKSLLKAMECCGYSNIAIKQRVSPTMRANYTANFNKMMEVKSDGNQ